MRPLFTVILISALFLLPGLRLANVPISTIFLLCGVYVASFQPQLPEAYMKAFLVVLSYMLLFSIRNALLPSGGAREFLYLLMVVGHLLVFATCHDLFQKGLGDLIVRALLMFAAFEVFMMVAQNLNLGGINQILSPLFEFYLSLTDSKSFLRTIQERPFGTMSNAMLAGMTAYLAMRTVAVYTGKRHYVYFALPAILISASRMALMMFITYELLVPFLVRSGRLRSLLILAATLTVVAGAAFFLQDMLQNLYVFRFAGEVTEGGLSENYSLINRINSYFWAYEKLDQFLLFGGVTTEEFSQRSAPVDSELVLRSLQFGFTGYLLMIWLSSALVLKEKNYDSFFIVFFLIVGSITNTIASNFLFMPFVALYVGGLKYRLEQRRLRENLLVQWRLAALNDSSEPQHMAANAPAVRRTI